MANLLVVEKYNVINNQVLSANTDYENAYVISKTGYTPIGVVGFYTSGAYSSRYNVYRATVYNGSVHYGIRGSEASTGLTLEIAVLWKKN